MDKLITRLRKARKLMLLSFLFMIVCQQYVIAQTQTVSGKVVDASTNETVIGATVRIKGTSSGVSTDANGTFRLAAMTSAVLEISSVGYTTLSVSADFSKPMVIRLSSASAQLNDVVVVGYGTQKKTTLTGSVATVDAKTFQDRGPVSSPLAALQGQVPGVAVTRNSAQPGRENWTFQVRGATSTNGTEPLVIVDGFPVPTTNALNSLNPNDIDNISFLKDAAASSIYGARAAGGVVLITTKRAKAGKVTVDYNGSYSIKSVGLQPKLVDIRGWGPMIKEAREADGFGATDMWINLANASIYAKQNGLNYLTKTQYDAAGFTGFSDVKDFTFFDGTMQDILWGNAASTEHQLSISSKNDKSGYRVSLGYLQDGSLLQYGNNSNKRYNVRLTHDYNLSSKLKLESNISVEKNDIIQPTGIGTVLNNGVQPGQPATTINGKPYLWGSGILNAATNNIAEYGGDNKEMNTRVNTNFNLTYNILKNLKAVGSAGYYFNHTDYRTQENVVAWYDYLETTNIANLNSSGTGRNYYQRTSRKEDYYNLNGYLEYSKVFHTDHDFKAMAGAQYERDEVNSFLGRTLDVLANVPPSLSLSYGDPTTKSVAEIQNHYALGGYFGRLNYAFKNKYLLEANARYDGSSRFRPEDRWKLFYGFSGGWRITQEDFMKDISFINELKLRVSWGSVGNQSGIGLYDYLQFLNLNYSNGPGANSFPIIGNTPVVRVSPAGLVAYDRTWETIQTSNAGLDFAFLDSRLTGSFDYFIKQNKNMLIARTFSAVLGTNAPAGNNGELKSWGWEFGLNWRGQINEFSYHIGGNISDAQNKLVSFGGQKLISSADQGFNSAVEGYPVNSYFGLKYDGRIQTEEQLAAYKKLATGSNVLPQGTTRNNGLQLGDNMFKDVNGDGKITFPEDAVQIGTDDPRYSYSFNAGFNWKGFDFNVIFQGVGKRTISRTGNWRIPAAVVFQAQNEAYLDKWWTPARTDAEYPRISTTGTINNYNYYASDWVAQNGSFLRLKNLVVGYTIPQSFTRKAKIERLRVYFSGNDLWEVSHINDGWDPEAPRAVANTGDTNNNNVVTFSQRFPFYRYFTFGVNLTF